MKFRNLLGLSAIGGFLYLHFRRGGQLTFDSFADTGRQLFGHAKAQGEELDVTAEQRIVHAVESRADEAAETD